MSIEATEHVGPVIFWRKELRDGSGGAGEFRGGLGQIVEISPTDGHEIYFNAMFDRIEHPPRGREGGGPGAAGAVLLDDGTVLAGKGRQHVPAGRRLILQLPGGGGFGAPEKRDTAAIQRDLDYGYVS
jgi:N-methylhydantoinase B